MIELPDWMQVLHVRADGETTGEHVARIVRALDGISLHSHADHLAELFWANEETEARASLVSSWKTNCGTSMRCVYALAGSDLDLILCPYVVGRAVSWVLQAAMTAKALLPGTHWRSLGPGWGMHYGTPGLNNDHVEFCLSVPDAVGIADHGGGGRPDNAITVGRGSILSSSGRPLLSIIDPARMVQAEATGDDPY